MLISRLFAFVTAFLAVSAAGCGGDDGESNSPKPEEGVKIVAGYNGGVRKMILEGEVQPGSVPRVVFAVRVQAADGPTEEFREPVKSRELVYQGPREVDENGDRWTEYVFQSSRGRKLVFAYPVVSLSQDFRDRHGTHFPFIRSELPYALAAVADPGRDTMYYPLIDLSDYEAPRRALMEDRVPVDRRPPSTIDDDLLALGSDATTMDRAVEALRSLDANEPAMTDVQRTTFKPLAIALSRLEDKTLAEMATGLCLRRGWFDDISVRIAIDNLMAEAPAKVLQAIAALKVYLSSSHARDRCKVSIPYVLKKRPDLPENIRHELGVLKKLLDEYGG